ncbi:MAG: PEP-CTERM sorting domain-containing protein [Calothrix sp. MO_192.B10]|nr:PEP-CTERM sorting domain-containing protein [Calothrix sp. MO_192.B10]
MIIILQKADNSQAIIPRLMQNLNTRLHSPRFVFDIWKSKIWSALHLSVSIAALSITIPQSAIAANFYNFQTIDFPGESETAVSSINNSGQFVGTFNDGESAFLFDGVNFTAFKPPGAGETYIPGMNDLGQIVGGFFDAEDIPRAYLKQGNTYNTINYPANPPQVTVGETGLSDINNAGIAVGYYFDENFDVSRAFSLDTNTNTFTPITIPTATERTYAWGINDLNQVVGSYRSDSGFFGYFLDQGNITKLEFPGSSLTAAYGVNDEGTIVGSFFREATGRDLYGFVWNDGVFTEITAPGATQTFVSSINDSGQIAGYYFDATGTKRGFIATPVPEPSAGLGLVAFGALGTVLLGKRKQNHQKITK